MLAENNQQFQIGKSISIQVDVVRHVLNFQSSLTK